MNVLSVTRHALEALKIGKSLLHIEAWKNAQAVSSLLVALVAVVRACGVDFGIDDSTLAAVGVAIAALVNTYLTYATSKKVGLPVETPPNIEPLETPNPATPVKPHFVERRTLHHETVRNSIMPPANVGAARERHGKRLSDDATAGMDRRGRPRVETVPTDQRAVPRLRESDAGWNDRSF